MANDFARVVRSIWSDDDFRALSHGAQWLYFHLLTSPSLNYCGVTDWRPKRIAALTADLTEDTVEAYSVELEGNLFTVVDRDSEEALIRTFIRHDGLMASPNMAAAMSKAHAGTVSGALRGVVVHELKRLQKDEPDLRGWNRPESRTLLRREAVTPQEAFDKLPRYTFGLGSGNPSVKGSGNPSENPSTKRSPTPAPAPTPSPNSPSSSGLRNSSHQEATP